MNRLAKLALPVALIIFALPVAAQSGYVIEIAVSGIEFGYEDSGARIEPVETIIMDMTFGQNVYPVHGIISMTDRNVLFDGTCADAIDGIYCEISGWSYRLNFSIDVDTLGGTVHSADLTGTYRNQIGAVRIVGFSTTE